MHPSPSNRPARYAISIGSSIRLSASARPLGVALAEPARQRVGRGLALLPALFLAPEIAPAASSHRGRSLADHRCSGARRLHRGLLDLATDRMHFVELGTVGFE